MKPSATRKRIMSCFAQIINGYVLGYKVPKLVKHERARVRKLSKCLLLWYGSAKMKDSACRRVEDMLICGATILGFYYCFRFFF